MRFSNTVHVWFLILIPGSFSLNVLMITIGAAGHVIPLFELAKAMTNHNVTFITEAHARTYIDLKSYANFSSFRIVYTNDSDDAFINAKKKEKEALEYFLNHSLLDTFTAMIPLLSESLNSLLTKSIFILMSERFDVIIGTKLIIGMQALCKVANASCVMQLAEQQLDMIDVNLPDSFSLLSPQQLTEFQYRVYNFAFTLRFAVPLIKTLIKMYYTIFSSLPQISGPFHEAFTMQNLLFSKVDCLKLFSLPPTLYPRSSSHYDTKYLGGFVDESSIEYVNSTLTRWVLSKPSNSIIYVAFGSISVLNHERMKNLIYGLAEFIQQSDEISVLLAFRGANNDNYQIVLNEMKNDQYRRILTDDKRVRVESEFLQQKWVLQQNTVQLFLSHCGMGSIVEAIYFRKPILCLPLCMDQFANAIAIYHSGIGESLFTPPSLLNSFITPVDHHDFTFPASDVTRKVLKMWRNTSYERAVQLMSFEMKHAGGVRRAVEEIELLVNLNGSLDRYKPFYSTLPLYQRYLLDSIFIFIVLPLVVVFYLYVKCCRRNRKKKID